MIKINVTIENKVYKELKNQSGDLSTCVNKAIARKLKIKTNEDILDEVSEKIEDFLKQKNNTTLKFETFYIGEKCQLESNEILFYNYNGLIILSLTDGKVSVGVRFNSVAKELRQELLNKLNANVNKDSDFKITEASRHTSCGFDSKKNDIISKMDQQKLYDYFVELYPLIF